MAWLATSLLVGGAGIQHSCGGRRLALQYMGLGPSMAGSLAQGVPGLVLTYLCVSKPLTLIS